MTAQVQKVCVHSSYMLNSCLSSVFEMCDLGSLGFPLLSEHPRDRHLWWFSFPTPELATFLPPHRSSPDAPVWMPGEGGKNLHVVSIELCQLLHHC